MARIDHQKSDIFTSRNQRLLFLLVISLSFEIVVLAEVVETPSTVRTPLPEEASTSRSLMSVSSPMEATSPSASPAIRTPTPKVETPPANESTSDNSKKQRSSEQSQSQAQFMEAIAAKRHGGGRQEGIIAGVVFSCIFVILFSIGTAYIYVTRRYNIDRGSEKGGSFRSEIDGAISAAV